MFNNQDVHNNDVSIIPEGVVRADPCLAAANFTILMNHALVHCVVRFRGC